MSFSPVLASKNIVKKYNRYLKTIFKIREPYNKLFQKEIDSMGAFAKGPYLEVTDSFIKGSSLKELVSEKVLPKCFSRIGIPFERNLYKHQEVAIRKATAEGKNLIVSTGTGSGKTESFLIPILAHLCREYENKTLTPGVRALIIYPMNALANDQVERLRTVLENFPEITYGSYTGQTKQYFPEALAEYKSMNNNEEPLKNELISREQMLETPPNILITNYAMLEYLMLRPKENVFFNGLYADSWRFIVLDEAHVYSGSTGIEVSMLLRRLKATLQSHNLQYILTSATLGDKETDAEVAKFGENLCDAKFDKESIVRAYRYTPVISRETKVLPLGFYRALASKGLEKISIDDIRSSLNTGTYTVKSENIKEIVYDIVLHDYNYWIMRENLRYPKTVKELSELMNWEERDVELFSEVAAYGEKNGDRLLDPRYHMFIRATESVFITLAPAENLILSREDFHNHKGIDYKTFEIATCNSCGSIYLMGKVDESGCLSQHSSMEPFKENDVYLLAEEISDTDDEHLLETENINALASEICPRCGFIRKKGSSRCCEHDSSDFVSVYKIINEKNKDTLTKCLHCEAVNYNGVLRMFFTGQEAVTSVIGTALYEELPSYIIEEEFIVTDDDSGFDMGETQKIEKKKNVAKQFIAFSDSRQAAAFYASYLDLTYKNILYKRLIVESLKLQRKESLLAKEFIENLTYLFEINKISIEEGSSKEAWKAFLSELTDNRSVTSLYSMGLLQLSVDDVIAKENSKFKLSKEEIASINNVIAMGMMSEAALSYEAMLNKADKEFFTHNGVEYKYNYSDSDSKGYTLSFIPSRKGFSNRRVDYLSRVLNKKGLSSSYEDIITLLKGIWNFFFIRNGGLMTQSDGSYRLNVNKIKVNKGRVNYRCNKCHKITINNVEGVCPTYKCDGELEKISCDEVFKENHYYRLYNDMDIRSLNVVEHTAQLDRETAYEYQKKFKKKEIDVLSCSTTFEMGVDVGSLETVFMRNMPPSPSNYAQRAGRAGRSSESAAYAITFCNKSSHDFTFYREPTRMIKGKINPPSFRVDNDKISVRHLYASALSFFWKKYPQYYSTISAFVEADSEGSTGIEVFKHYLNSKPEDLKTFLLRFLPLELSKKFRVDTFGWIPLLLGEDGVLTKAISEYNYELDIIKNAIDEGNRQGVYTDNLKRRLKAYERESVISFFSKKNVLPKYGFPVDTVEMTIMEKKKGKGSTIGLQLQRDLSMAISEYAPGSEIVANNNLITSRYIKKVPNMNWKIFSYISCDKCKTLNIAPYTEDITPEELSSCKQCGESFSGNRVKAFIIPSFGFEADGENIRKPGLKKPERTYRGEVSYVGYLNKINPERIDIGKGRVEMLLSQNDEMAVLNTSGFYVCESCGFSIHNSDNYMRVINKSHKNSAGYKCGNDKLRQFSLGYRFQTDVVQLRFLDYYIGTREKALSILYGILRGICSYLSIEESDISGCLQYYYNENLKSGDYSIILYDRTPGGAGHVRRVSNKVTLEGVLIHTLKLMSECICGGKTGETSCYSCLRSYENQKYHDELKRGYVIEFIKNMM